MSKIFINSSGTAELMKDMGVEIPANGQLIIDPASYFKLAASSDAIVCLGKPHITYNDGTNNLSENDAVQHIIGGLTKEVSTTNITLTWSEFKTLVSVPGALRKVVYIEGPTYTNMFVNVHGIVARCMITKATAEHDEWDLTYKISANKPVVDNPAFASNEDEGGGILLKDERGMQFNVIVGVNQLDFVVDTYKVRFDEIEILSGEKKDKVTLQILDTPFGSYTGTPNKVLHQFGNEVNVKKDEYSKKSKYSAYIYQGMRITMLYNSISAKDIEANYSLHQVVT